VFSTVANGLGAWRKKKPVAKSDATGSVSVIQSAKTVREITERFF